MMRLGVAWALVLGAEGSSYDVEGYGGLEGAMAAVQHRHQEQHRGLQVRHATQHSTHYHPHIR
jgi:hypothetical protein|eukprot:COSAG02_NODE_14256_length_1292_cov_2.460184_1_plen_63_part_00